ncbi:MAG: folate family ECF transporter S component [Clostridia bacterium]|jgi:ECF transporter S component (folate family)
MKKTTIKHLSTKTIAYTAMFAAISVVLNAFTIPFSILGTAVSFNYIPCVLAGAFLGPIPGLLVGLIGDGLGVIIAPKGPWIPLITLGSGMMGLIPGLTFKIKNVPPLLLLLISFLGIYLVTTLTLNTLGLYLMYAQGRKTFWVYLAGRIPMQSLMLGINLAITYGLYLILDKTIFKKRRLKPSSNSIDSIPEKASEGNYLHK